MDDNLKEMLDVDISKISEEGKKSNRSKLKKIIIVVVIAIAVSVAGYFGVKESAYKKAFSLANAGDYTDAITAFENLNNYRNSKENVEKVTLAEDFMKSNVYNTQWLQFNKELTDYKTIFTNMNFDPSFNWNEEAFVIRISSDSFSKSNMEVNDKLTTAILPSFITLCHDVNKSSLNIQKAAKVAGGYALNCQIECIGTDGELLYSSLNGEEQSSCIDIAATEEALYGQSYQAMVDAIDAKEYAKCCEIWDTLNADGYYSLSYKDISDYYYYAKVMSAYTSKEAVSLSILQSNLKNVSQDFKDIKDIEDKITAITESAGSVLNGTYHKDCCELKIENGSLAWQFVSGSEKGNDLSAKIDDYYITDGEVSEAHAVETGTAEEMGITVTKTDSGVKVAFENSDDAAKYGGAYLPGAAPVEAQEVKNNSNTTTNRKTSSTMGTASNSKTESTGTTEPVSATGVLADIQGIWQGDYYKLTIKGSTYILSGKVNYYDGSVFCYESGTVTVGEKYGAYYYLSFVASQHKETNAQGEQVNPHEKGGFGLHVYYNGAAQITGYTRIG